MTARTYWTCTIARARGAGEASEAAGVKLVKTERSGDVKPVRSPNVVNCVSTADAMKLLNRENFAKQLK
jgi:hypothetical protein